MNSTSGDSLVAGMDRFNHGVKIAELSIGGTYSKYCLPLRGVQIADSTKFWIHSLHQQIHIGRHVSDFNIITQQSLIYKLRFGLGYENPVERCRHDICIIHYSF